MLIRHATPRRNLPSIGRSSLLCAKSRGWMRVVWLHARSNNDTAGREQKRRNNRSNRQDSSRKSARRA